MSGATLRSVGLVLASGVLVAGSCTVVWSPLDLMLHLDRLDPDTGRAAEILPGVPWIRPGPDGELDSEDDVIDPAVVGDIDLVLRAGISAFGDAIPDPSAALGLAPEAVAEPFGLGTEVEFVVTASDGAAPSPYGNPVVSPSLEGVPIIVAAFADLDADGFVGITQLDGDPLDAALEEAEFTPVGVRLAIASGGRAAGRLRIRAGGPEAAPLRVVLAAAAYAGPLDPAFFGGVVPDGPAVLTQFPFLPRLAPDRVIDAGPSGPAPADPLEPPAVEIEADLDPNPADPRIGEAFTLRTDGSEPTVDIAVVRSGAFTRYGLAQTPDPQSYRGLSRRPLRTGVDAFGAPVLLEILQRVVVADDGSASQTRVRIVGLDRLGNVADPASGDWVTLSTGGVVMIASPDTDGDPFSETVFVADTSGVELVLDDLGGAFDGPNVDSLVVEGAGVLAQVDAVLPDPDVDDSGLVDELDLLIVDLFKGLRLGEPGFQPGLDVNGDGRVKGDDFDLIEELLGLSVPAP